MPAKPSSNHIFMSYSRRDEAVMQRVLRYLRKQGIKVWLDHEKLVPGTPIWEREIEKAIKNAAAIVVICSPDSNNSEWVRREITFAERYRKRIFPILASGDEDTSISIRLSTRQYVDIRRKEEMGIRSLGTALSSYLKAREEVGQIGEKVLPEKSVEQPASKLISWPFSITGNVLLVIIILIIGGTVIYQKVFPPDEKTPTPTPTLTITPIPTLGVGSTQISEKDDMVMLYIPAGEFVMGGENGDSDEKPVHTVYLDAFWIDQTEVTNEMFAKFIEDTGYETDAQKAGSSYVYRDGSWQKVNGADWQHPLGVGSDISDIMDHPAGHISWNDANAYCEWADLRLPTEAEWEKAARGGLEGKAYPWGDAAPVCEEGANNGAQYGNCGGDTVSVGSFGENGYGLYDMVGNIREWVADWYDSNYYGSSPSGNPTGSLSRDYKGLRGGSWYDNEYYLRVSYRDKNIPSDPYDLLGFRCARDATP